MVRAGRRRRLTPTQQWLEEDAKRKRESAAKTEEQRAQRAARAAARASRVLSPPPPISPHLATARASSTPPQQRQHGDDSLVAGDGVPGVGAAHAGDSVKRGEDTSRSNASMQDADDGQGMFDVLGMDMRDASDGNAASAALSIASLATARSPAASPGHNNGVSNSRAASPLLPTAQSSPPAQQPHGSVGADVSLSGDRGGADTAAGGVRQAGAVADAVGMGPVDPSSSGQVAHSARAAVEGAGAGGGDRQDHVVQYPAGLYVHQAAKEHDIRNWCVPARLLMSLYHASAGGPATKATLVPLTRSLYRARKEMAMFDKKVRALERLPGLVATEGAGKDKTWRLGPRASEYGVDKNTQLALLVHIQAGDVRAAQQ